MAKELALSSYENNGIDIFSFKNASILGIAGYFALLCEDPSKLLFFSPTLEIVEQVCLGCILDPPM